MTLGVLPPDEKPNTPHANGQLKSDARPEGRHLFSIVWELPAKPTKDGDSYPDDADHPDHYSSTIMLWIGVRNRYSRKCRVEEKPEAEAQELEGCRGGFECIEELICHCRSTKTLQSQTDNNVI